LTNGRASGWFLTKSALEICKRLSDNSQRDEIRTHAHADIARRRVSGSSGWAISLSQNVVNVVLRKVSRPKPVGKKGCGPWKITVRHRLSVC
jgi:hypothetical protein